MDPLISVADCLWYYYATPFGIYCMEFYFYFIIDAVGPQMISLTYLHLVDDYVFPNQPPLFFALFKVLMP